MIDLKHKKCIEKNCSKIPAFNYISHKPIYCSEHKNVITKRCLEENCNKISNFNLSNEKFGLYCSTQNMIDLKHKKCIEKKLQ